MMTTTLNGVGQELPIERKTSIKVCLGIRKCSADAMLYYDIMKLLLCQKLSSQQCNDDRNVGPK